MSGHEVEIHVDATPVVLYDLLTDIGRMPQWSPEVVRCHWVRGASGPRAGACFRGWSRKGWHTWSTLSVVTIADRPETFEWRVTFVGRPVATWRYTMLENDQGGTTLREVVVDERGRGLQRLSPFITGSRDRMERNDETMRVTLARLKVAAEAHADPR